MPKFLIISHNSFSKTSNNGKSLESIFGNYSKENLAQLFFSQNEDPDFTFCNNYFKITDTDIIKNLITLSKSNGGIINCNSNTNSFSKNKFKNYIFKFLKKNASKIILFRDLLWKVGKWKTPALFKWIKNFNPDIIFYVGGNNGFSHDIATYIQDKYSLPLVTFFTDDYLINPKYDNLLSKIQHHRMNKFYHRTIKKSSLCFTIGELMSKEYSNYFKKDFLYIMNSIPIEPYIIPDKRNNKITISYIGGLHLNRWKMICEFAQIINQIGSSYILSINVYTTTSLTQEMLQSFTNNHINYRGAVFGTELNKAFNDTDLLLHVESNEQYYRSLTKLSVSTKIPEYLATGKCIIGYGPIEVASMRLLSDNNIGIVISSDNNNNYQGLATALEDYNFRIEIGKNGYDFANKYFETKYVREKFHNNIINIIKK